MRDSTQTGAFSALGKYKGHPPKARGCGGPMLAMRDGSTPYALKIGASIGRTAVRAQGTITSLVKFSTVDMRLALSGASLEDLYPLLGIASPASRAYTTEGHLLHSGTTRRYQNLMEKIGLYLWEILELNVTGDNLSGRAAAWPTSTSRTASCTPMH